MKAFETELAWRFLRRVGQVHIAILEEDGESLQVMAREFENPRSGFLPCVLECHYRSFRSFGRGAERCS